jgi:hypothetical protein
VTGRTWRLELTFSTLPLSLNDRRHRMVIWREARNLRDQVRWLARAQGIPRLERIHVQMHWTPATVRIRDVENTIPTQKAAIDGLRDYSARFNRSGLMTSPAWVGIVADDDPAHVTWSPPIIHPVDRTLTKRLWIDIEDRSEQ